MAIVVKQDDNKETIVKKIHEDFQAEFSGKMSPKEQYESIINKSNILRINIENNIATWKKEKDFLDNWPKYNFKSYFARKKQNKKMTLLIEEGNLFLKKTGEINQYLMDMLPIEKEKLESVAHTLFNKNTEVLSDFLLNMMKILTSKKSN